MTRKAFVVAAAIVAASACGPAPRRPAPTFPAGDAESWFRFQRTYPNRSSKLDEPIGRLPIEPGNGPGIHPNFSLTSSQWTLIGPQPILDPLISRSSFSGRVTAIAAHPTDPSTVYIGGDIGGVWKTTDAGGTWTSVTPPDLPYPAINSIAIDPVNPNIVYASTTPTYGSRLIRTTDAGRTWQTLPLTDDGGNAVAVIYKVLVDPRRAGAPETTTLYLMRGGWLYRSDDGGKTLRTIYAASTDIGGPTDIYDEFLEDVAFDRANSDRLLLVTARYACRKPCTAGDAAIMFYRSSDGGGHWSGKRVADYPDYYGLQTARIAMSSQSGSVVISFRDSQAQKLRVMRSVDLGDSWNEMPTQKPTSYAWPNALALGQTNDVIYLGNFHVTTSFNSGQTWNDLGAPHEDETVLTFDASNRLLLGSDAGVFRSNVSSSGFTTLNQTLSLTECYAIAAHPTNPLKLLIGTQDNGTVEYLGSAGWNRVFAGDGGDVAFDATGDANAGYLETQWTTSTYAFEYCVEGGSCQTRVSGIDRTLNAPFIPRFAVDPANSATVFLTTERLYRTDNRGASWAAVTPSVSANQRCWDDSTGRNCANAVYFTAVTVAPTSSQTIYAGTANGDVWLSSARGDTWTSVAAAPLPVRPVSQIAIDPADPGTAFVTYSSLAMYGGGPGHVFRTSNAGRTWTDVSGDLPDVAVFTILIDPETNPRTLYIGTDFGIMRSVDGSGHWEAFNNGLPSVPVERLVYNKTTQTLLAATYGRGVWVMSNRFAR